jgi:hypothetical protein
MPTYSCLCAARFVRQTQGHLTPVAEPKDFREQESSQYPCCNVAIPEAITAMLMMVAMLC